VRTPLTHWISNASKEPFIPVPFCRLYKQCTLISIQLSLLSSAGWKINSRLQILYSVKSASDWAVSCLLSALKVQQFATIGHGGWLHNALRYHTSHLYQTLWSAFCNIPNYKVAFNYPKLWQHYAVLFTITHKSFTLHSSHLS